MGWNRSIVVKERLGGTTHEGRRIIFRDTPIDLGVYPGAGMREAIVVDSRKDPQIRILYEKAKLRAQSRRLGFLTAVFQIVSEEIPYNEERANHLISRLNAWHDKKLYLGHFIEEHCGVCRHQALAAGVIIELATKEFRDSGRSSIDRNDSYAAHVWVRHYGSDSRIYILDVAQRFLGTLQESVRCPWDYFRPGEAKPKK